MLFRSLPMANVPLVIGPVIAADPPPDSFAPFRSRPCTPLAQPRYHPNRIASSLQSRLVVRSGLRQTYFQRARRILIGNALAANRMKPEWRSKCRRLTYSGVEHEVFVPPSERKTTETLRLLFVGRLVPYKGVELLLRAAALAARRCAFKLEIIGASDPVYERFLRQLANELQLESLVRFRPPCPRNELVWHYQRADVFCFPTLCDTYGIALLEAMSCGCATLVSDVAAAGEIVNRQTGHRVLLNNPEQYIVEFADAIAQLAANRSRTRALGEAARPYVVEFHDWGKIGRDLLQIYEELRLELGSPQ